MSRHSIVRATAVSAVLPTLLLSTAAAGQDQHIDPSLIIPLLAILALLALLLLLAVRRRHPGFLLEPRTPYSSRTREGAGVRR